MTENFKILFCSFHREQSWKRKINSKIASATLTNNGVETKHRLLNEGFLKTLSPNRNMLELIKIIIEGSIYIVKNAELSSKYALYNPKLPKFLHNRPHSFIIHVMKRILIDYNIVIKIVENEQKMTLQCIIRSIFI